MDPVDIWKEQVGVAVALFCEQVLQWTDNCVAQLKNAQRQLPPLPPPPSLPSLPPPKDKEELSDSGVIIHFEEEEDEQEKEQKKTNKRPSLEEQEENSQELSDSSDSDSFINDKEEEEEEEEELSSSNRSPSPVHRSLIPKSGRNGSGRVRKAPRRFSPSRVSDAKKDDEKAERKGISIGKRSDKEQDEWQLVQKKTSAQQKRNKWFRSRWGDQLDAIRSALGRESETNMAPRALWDAIEEKPERFDFRNCSMERTICAFCGALRRCTWKTYYDGDMHYMGGCCANLAKTWQSFSVARLNMEPLAEMDELFEKVQDAHVAKSKY